jgi:hypothetical protein
MADEGYLNHDPLMHLINLKWYLRVVTNATIDAAIHVDGMTRDQAIQLMIEGGFQEEREASGKWVRAQLTSAQLSTYFVGYRQIHSIPAISFIRRSVLFILSATGSARCSPTYGIAATTNTGMNSSKSVDEPSD